MNELLATLTIMAFFVLRLSIPILLIILVGTLMSRLDARWQMHS
ncbi:MAG: hypothetical protein R6X32_17895 [Chloroflexota bacterium]|jgi:hypothetical protein